MAAVVEDYVRNASDADKARLLEGLLGLVGAEAVAPVTSGTVLGAAYRTLFLSYRLEDARAQVAEYLGGSREEPADLRVLDDSQYEEIAEKYRFGDDNVAANTRWQSIIGDYFDENGLDYGECRARMARLEAEA